jgi:hypothetical protein
MRAVKISGALHHRTTCDGVIKLGEVLIITSQQIYNSILAREYSIHPIAFQYPARPIFKKNRVSARNPVFCKRTDYGGEVSVIV